MTTQVISSSKKSKRQMNPKSIANLIPYKKGENGHKGGYNLTERLRHQLDHPLIEPGENAPTGERLVYATLKGALELVPSPFHETWDRAEGKVPDKHAIVGDIVIRIVEDDD